MRDICHSGFPIGYLHQVRRNRSFLPHGETSHLTKRYSDYYEVLSLRPSISSLV